MINDTDSYGFLQILGVKNTDCHPKNVACLLYIRFNKRMSENVYLV